jgi:Cu-Zn family superoxide dismutase
MCSALSLLFHSGWHVQVIILSSKAGNLASGCFSTGLHFNPLAKDHGAPPSTERHVGDLGNIATNDQGVAVFNFSVNLMSLNEPNSIIG